MSTPPLLSPLQRAVYETDQLGLNLRDSVRLVTQKLGFFVGQQRYLAERKRVEAIIAQYGTPIGGGDPDDHARSTPHQIGSAS
ncbi:MAG: hypothetical protein HYX52_06725 [Chloroflexi bacterium]|nr:hypothetical protein [Chloroflexota bacterium]